jgi:hypothetical protein
MPRSEAESLERLKTSAESILSWISSVERGLLSDWDKKRAVEVAEAKALMEKCRKFGITDLGDRIEGIANAAQIVAGDEQLRKERAKPNPGDSLPWLRLRISGRQCGVSGAPAAFEALALLALPCHQVVQTPNPTWDRVFEIASQIAPCLARAIVAIGPVLSWEQAASTAAGFVNL